MLGVKRNKNLDTSVKTLPLDRCLAKSVECADGCVRQGVSVADHCRIAGYVAEELLNAMSPCQRSLLPKSAPFYVAIHDIGKVSPDFQKMIYSSIDASNFPPELKNAELGRAKRKEPSFHGKVSQVTLENVAKGANTLSLLEGMHHGFKPNPTPFGDNADIYGGEAWSIERRKLYEILKEKFPCDSLDISEDWKTAGVVGGFITVADWIASGGAFSDLVLNHTKTEDELKNMAREAVLRAGFGRYSIRKGLSFEEIFGFSPRKIQSDLFESVTGPGVYVLEAPMGLGKTEASLYAAYKMLEKGMASGIYFGLPTQLTSNKIYERVEKFLDCIVQNRTKGFFQLLHGSAWLEEDSMGEEACSGGSWFDSKKRGILAPFAVGTIDQALMAAMNVKHSMVRSFGLAGKVVILDEVHSYDAYTGTIMNELVDQLKTIGCTVIILSATLTSSQKKNILKLSKSTDLNESYPLITVNNSNFQEIVCDADAGISADCFVESNETKAFDEAIKRASSGQQVLWIENTVANAQDIYKHVAARALQLGVECGLIHSRFTKQQRSENESKWVSLYGKDGLEKRSINGRILVGTQVLEQSIDIDSDFLVTRICPMDMLLQRIGRLWRHRANDAVRPKNAKCELMILSPSYDEAVRNEKSFETTGVVYSPYVLCRTLDVLQGVNKISLPCDIRPLLEKVYKDRTELGTLSKMKADLEKIQGTLQGMARVGLSTAIQTMPETAVQTRYSELQTYNILLLSGFRIVEEGTYVTFWGETSEVFVPRKCSNAQDKRAMAKQIMMHSVAVSGNSSLSNIPKWDDKANLFGEYVYLGKKNNVDDDEDCLFRVVKVDEDGSFRNLQNIRIEVGDGLKKQSYTKNFGYQVES